MKKGTFGIVQDDRGRILGKIVSRSQMLREDMEIVKNFLLEIQKKELGMATKQTAAAVENCNLVWLAGIIRALKVRDDASAFMLLDSSSDQTKYIPCTVHDDMELSKALGRFRVGDQIKLHGFVRAWSQKKNEAWENKVEIRITAIKSPPPARSAGVANNDDDIPF